MEKGDFPFYFFETRDFPILMTVLRKGSSTSCEVEFRKRKEYYYINAKTVGKGPHDVAADILRKNRPCQFYHRGIGDQCKDCPHEYKQPIIIHTLIKTQLMN